MLKPFNPLRRYYKRFKTKQLSYVFYNKDTGKFGESNLPGFQQYQVYKLDKSPVIMYEHIETQDPVTGWLKFGIAINIKPGKYPFIKVCGTKEQWVPVPEGNYLFQK
jgi:hypothetical protein